VEYTAQQVENFSAARKECVKVNVMWKELHRMWTMLLQLERRVLQ